MAMKITFLFLNLAKIHIFIPSFGQNLDNMDDNKEKLTAKFAKMAKTFSILYVFYVFALCDSKGRSQKIRMEI